jgi:hypothetical protein
VCAFRGFFRVSDRIDGLLAVLLSRIKDRAGLDAFHALRDELDGLVKQLAEFKAAFENTAADRDRLAGQIDELGQYKSAFQGTAIDRDLWKARSEELLAALQDLREANETFKDEAATQRETLAVLSAERDRLVADMRELDAGRMKFSGTGCDRDL